jgi:hypothetical protein
MVYRNVETGEVETDPQPQIEDGLRDALVILKPFDADDVTLILLAISALYDLPLTRKGEA